MLTQAENELLCRVEGEAPMGALMRRHWVPALLSEQVAELSGAIDGLRQSYASAPSTEVSSPRSAHRTSIRFRPHANKGAHRKLAKSRH